MSMKIICRSARFVQKIEDDVISSIDSVIKENITWTDEEKQRVREKFKEIFSKTLHDNVLSANKASADAHEDDESCTDMEPLDPEKKKVLNEVVYPRFGTQLVETTKMRRQGPRKCAQQYSKQCHFECQYLNKVKVKLPEVDLTQISEVNENDLLNNVSTLAHAVRQSTQDITEAEELASEIVAVMNTKELLFEK